jgi:hypothetical protein
MDGFYAAYLTGRGGNTVLLLAIKASSIIGVDMGGLKYDGTVEPAPNGGFNFHVKYVIQPGSQLITGMGSVAAPTPVSLDFTVPADFASGTIVTIQTPFGPINAKMSKLREFDLPAS